MKWTYFLAGIVIVAPVAGLRPLRSPRLLVAKVPNPGIVTFSPASRAIAMIPLRECAENRASRISADLPWLRPVYFASFMAISVLFMSSS